MEVRIQSVVVEFILNHVDVLFSPKLSSLIREGTGMDTHRFHRMFKLFFFFYCYIFITNFFVILGHNSLSRPKSLLVPSPSTKLLTLEEAQARTQAQINSPITADSKYIEVGEGPAALQGKFHTVIEFPTERYNARFKIYNYVSVSVVMKRLSACYSHRDCGDKMCLFFICFLGKGSP